PLERTVLVRERPQLKLHQAAKGRVPADAHHVALPPHVVGDGVGCRQYTLISEPVADAVTVVGDAVRVSSLDTGVVRMHVPGGRPGVDLVCQAEGADARKLDSRG